MSDQAPSKLVPWIIAIALFMEGIDVSIITTAIPSMAKTFGINPIDIKFALTSYLLSLGLFIPISGFVADKWGTKRTFIAALILFTLSSFSCGYASTLYELIIARALQGLGGAFMMPVGWLTIQRVYPKSETLRIRNFVVMPGLIAPLIGPTIGGFITSYYPWPWIFYINVPIGIIAIFFSFKYMVNYTHPKRIPFDTLGFLLFGLSLSASFVVFESFHDQLLPQRILMTLAIGSLLGFLFFYYHYRKTAHPVIQLKLFFKRTFSVAAIANFLTRPNVSSVFILFPILLQVGFGLSPLASGLLICARPLGMMITKSFTPRLVKQIGVKKMLLATTLLSALSSFSFILITHLNIPLIFFLLLINGMITSPLFTLMNTLYYTDISSHEMSQATSIASTLQQFSTGIGITFCAFILQIFSEHNHPLESPFTFHRTFFIVGLLTLCTLPSLLKLKPTDGQRLAQ